MIKRIKSGENMDQDLLKTSTKQRVIIGLIAILMVGSIIASYAAIVLGKKDNTTTSTSDDPLIAKYETPYNEVLREVQSSTKSYFDEFIKHKGEVVAYNEAAANDNGVVTRDITEGSGRELTEGDTNYLAFYVGWCADETIFDSSYNSTTKPTAFSTILNASQGLIEGWNIGVQGMKLGGIREITVPGELAYGESREICGGTNKPLKFMIMAIANEGELGSLAERFSLAQMKLQYAYYGLDYDEMMVEDEADEEEVEE
jgi:peptidylprolyl isomerase